MRFTKYATLFMTFTLGCGVCLAQGYSSASFARVPHGIPPKNASIMPASQSNVTTNGISYHGGPVLNRPSGTNVYFIWYGDWSSDSSKQILTDFIQNLGGSPYFNINTTYYDFDNAGRQDPVVNRVNFMGSVDDHYSMGNSLSDNNVAQVIANHIGVDFPVDQNGVYFVLTSADVNEQEFCTTFCAFHGPLSAFPAPNGHIFDIKGAWVGNPVNQCPAACLVQAPSPNNNPGADSMASFVAHELEESVTDPDLSAWYDPNGNEIVENADKCVWTFGNYLPLPGTPSCTIGIPGGGCGYNMKLGTHLYMIQQNWVNANGGFCALSWDQ